MRQMGWTPLLARPELRDGSYMSMKPWPRHRSRDVEDVAVDYPHDDLILSSVGGIQLQQADCCIANAAYRIVLPANAARPQPAELLLCGHHFRASQQALRHANASVFDAGDHLCEING